MFHFAIFRCSFLLSSAKTRRFTLILLSLCVAFAKVNPYNMREVISIHIGQAGVQVGNACWELFCLEHGSLRAGVWSKLQLQHETAETLSLIHI